MKWNDIDTAPKDGTCILVYCPFQERWAVNGGYQVVVKWQENVFSNGAGGWTGADDEPDEGSVYCGPTHWTPLPAPPGVDARPEKRTADGSLCDVAAPGFRLFSGTRG